MTLSKDNTQTPVTPATDEQRPASDAIIAELEKQIEFGGVSNGHIILALIARIRSSEPVWQDIATAPRDGTRILAYNPVIGVYNTAWNQTKDCTEEGFYCGFTNYVGVWYCSPTHWMPLPPKPLSYEGEQS